MAIFNKKKKDSVGSTSSQQSASNATNNAGVRNNSAASGPPSQSSPNQTDRAATTQQQRNGTAAGAARNQSDAAPSLSNSMSQTQLNSPTSSQSQPPPASLGASTSGPVLYPWAQRRLNLLPSALLNTSDSANPSLSTRGPISPLPFPRYGHSVNPVASSPAGDLYIFGGLVSNAVKNDLYVLSCAPIANQSVGPNGNVNVALVETKGEIPGPRVGHASVGVGNVLIVWGGDTKSRPEDRQDDGLYLLNLSTREWTRVKTIGLTPEGRYGHAAAMVGSKFFIFGGQRDDGGFMNDLVWFDLQKLKAGSPKWSFIEYEPGTIVPPARTGHTTVTHGDSIYVFGGTDGQYHYNDTWSYDTITGVWTELSCTGYIPVPREGHAATLVDDVMYIFGGRGVDGKDLEDLAAFKITSNRWFMFQNMGPSPSGRSGHAMATWNSQVYVLGGESYTSQRADDPTFVHVLDTTKIKYPQDSKPVVVRKTSIPLIANRSPQLNSSASAFDDAQRSVTPTTRQSPSLGVSVGQIMTSASKTNGNPPTRPFRSEDEGLQYYNRDGSLNSSRDAVDRALTPTLRQPHRRNDSLTDVEDRVAGSPISAIASFRSANRVTTAGGDSPPRHRRINSEASDRFDVTASPGSTTSRLGSLSNGRTFSHSADVLRVRDEEIEKLKTREAWMRATLALATSRGFLPEDGGDDGEGTSEGIKDLAGKDGAYHSQILDALISMKTELAKSKLATAEEAERVNERLAAATQARTSALQEASYYRSKLSALETGSDSDITKLELQRTQDLERRLAEVISAKLAVDQQLELLETDLHHHAGLQSAADERNSSALSRAESAETSYSRSLAELADLHRRVAEHDSVQQDQLGQITSLTSSTQQLNTSNAHLKEQIESSNASISNYLSTLEQAQLALAAANARADQTHAVWETSQDELARVQTRAQLLQTDLDANQVELDSATAKTADLERILKVTKEEHEATALLAAGGLAEVIASHREAMSRDVIPTEVHEDRVRAIQEEAATFKRMHSEARMKADDSIAELNDSRGREVELQTQLLSLRSELATLRGSHAQALVEVGRHQSIAATRDLDLRDASRGTETAELKASLLRSLMSEHGLVVDEKDLATRSAPFTGEEKAEDLHKRVMELEGQLDQRTRLHRELESEHNDAQRRLDDAERQLEGNEGVVVNGARAEELEKELVALESKHQTLETTHSKAVQYVKGTEKMLRRMKDELTRYKERVEELEAEVVESDSVIPADTKLELASLRTQIIELRTFSDQHQVDKQALERRMASAQSDYESRLHEREVDTTAKIHELEDELTRLDESLETAHYQLSETLATNSALSQQLASKPAGPGSPGRNGDSPRSQDPSFVQLKNKVDWLKRENVGLEERCRQAEEKVSILLDHMEDGEDMEDEEGSALENHDRYDNAVSPALHNTNQFAGAPPAMDSHRR